MSFAKLFLNTSWKLRCIKEYNVIKYSTLASKAKLRRQQRLKKQNILESNSMDDNELTLDDSININEYNMDIESSVENESNEIENKSIKITKPLEPTGQYLYGYNTVYSALKYNKRAFYHRLFVCPPILFYQNQLNAGVINRKQMDYDNIVDLCDKMSIPIEKCNKAELHNFIGNKKHDGYVLDCDSIIWPNAMDNSIELKENSKNIWILLDTSMNNEQYIGNIIRNCAYFGINGIIYCDKKINTLSKLITNYSFGGFDEMDIRILNGNDITNYIDSIKNNYTILSVKHNLMDTTNDNVISIHEFMQHRNQHSKNKGIILCVGNETRGIKPNLKDQCDYILDMNSPNKTNPGIIVDSLSIPCELSIILHHLMI